MWAIVGILLSGVIISFFEIPPFVKKKGWREIIVYFLLLFAGMAMAILLSKNVTIPTPVDWLIKIFSPVSTFLEQNLS